MSLPAVDAPVGAKFANGAGETWSAGPCSSDALSLREPAAAAAQSARAGRSGPAVLELDPLAQPAERVLAGISLDVGDVGLLDAVTRMRQSVR